MIRRKIWRTSHRPRHTQFESETETQRQARCPNSNFYDKNSTVIGLSQDVSKNVNSATATNSVDLFYRNELFIS